MRVQVEGVGVVEFPDTMSQDAVKEAIERDILPSRAAAPQRPAEAPAPSAATMRGREAGLPTRVMATALQGPLFNFADELLGGVAAVGEVPRAVLDRVRGKSQSIPDQVGNAYTSVRDEIRGSHERFKEDAPWLALGTEVLAGLPIGAPGAQALRSAVLAKNASKARALLEASKTGATMGGINAGGASKSLSDMPGDIAVGAGTGAVTGPAAQVVGGAAGAFKNLITQRVNPGSAQDAARRRVVEAFLRDQQMPQQAAARLPKLGPEGRIADVGGENVRQLLDTTATLPGRTKQATELAIRQRQVSRPERLTPITQPLNPSGIRANEAGAAFDAMKKAAGPLYERADPLPINDQSGVFGRLLSMEWFNRAMDKGSKMAANDIERGPWPGNMPRTLKDWDDVKKALDNDIGTLLASGAKEDARLLLKMKRELVGELDRQTGGAYKAARDAYAGAASMKDAMEQGTTVLSKSMSAAEIREIAQGLSQSELTAFRIGAAEALRTQVGSQPGQNQLLNLFKDRNMRERLQAVYGTGREYRKAVSTLLAEEKMRKLERVGRGSQTAGREAGMEDLAAGVISDMQGAAHGNVNPAGWASSISNIYKRLAVPETVRNDIGQLLLTQGPKAQSELNLLTSLAEKMKQEPSRQAAWYGLLGGRVPTSF